jgi:hypothetical protein
MASQARWEQRLHERLVAVNLNGDGDYRSACRPHQHRQEAGSHARVDTDNQRAHTAHSLLMGYHEAFWVTSGTVAPLIGLTHLVALGRNRGLITRGERDLWERVQDRNERAWELRERIARLSARVREHSLKSVNELTLDEREAFDRELHDLDTELRFIDTNTDVIEALHGRMPTNFPTVSGWAMGSDVVTAVSWIACLISLALALFSLALDRDVLSPTAACVLLLAATVTLVFTAAAGLMVRSKFKLDEGA